jgi:hypothetical protein
LADAPITDRQICAMVNARFQIRLTRRIVSMWRNMLRILDQPPFRVQFLTEQQKLYSHQWALDLLAMMDAAEAAGRTLIIAFSDEGRFCRDSDRRWVRDRRGQWDSTALGRMRKFPRGMMVWEVSAGDIDRRSFGALRECS